MAVPRGNENLFGKYVDQNAAAMATHSQDYRTNMDTMSRFFDRLAGTLNFFKQLRANQSLAEQEWTNRRALAQTELSARQAMQSEAIASQEAIADTEATLREMGLAEQHAYNAANLAQGEKQLNIAQGKLDLERQEAGPMAAYRTAMAEAARLDALFKPKELDLREQGIKASLKREENEQKRFDEELPLRKAQLEATTEDIKSRGADRQSDNFYKWLFGAANLYQNYQQMQQSRDIAEMQVTGEVPAKQPSLLERITGSLSGRPATTTTQPANAQNKVSDILAELSSGRTTTEEAINKVKDLPPRLAREARSEIIAVGGRKDREIAAKNAVIDQNVNATITNKLGLDARQIVPTLLEAKRAGRLSPEDEATLKTAQNELTSDVQEKIKGFKINNNNFSAQMKEAGKHIEDIKNSDLDEESKYRLGKTLEDKIQKSLGNTVSDEMEDREAFVQRLNRLNNLRKAQGKPPLGIKFRVTNMRSELYGTTNYVYRIDDTPEMSEDAYKQSVERFLAN